MAVTRMIQGNNHSLMLLDSHYIDVIDAKIVPILPVEFAKVIDAHVIIEANPKLILRRRVLDGSRTRSIRLVDIRKEMLAECDEARRVATENGKRFYSVQNRVPEDAANTLIYLLRKDGLVLA